ncbi:MAG: DUF1294 domain-containing protein [Pseudoxanthomonas sp.]
MRYMGRLHDWNDDKGFGFVTPSGGGVRAFVHAKAFERMSRRPTIGDLISYELTSDAKGRSNAIRVRFVTASAQIEPGGGRVPRKMIASVFLAMLGLAWVLGKVPAVLPLGCAAMSLATFLYYAMDKSAARHGQWRIQEGTLHLLSLLGGWPGALFAQGMLRHKTVKQPFQRIFWLTVVGNLIFLGWLWANGKASELDAWLW